MFALRTLLGTLLGPSRCHWDLIVTVLESLGISLGLFKVVLEVSRTLFGVSCALFGSLWVLFGISECRKHTFLRILAAWGHLGTTPGIY